MENRAVKIQSKKNPNVVMRIINGHFATNHSHINYFVDMTMLKARQKEAQGAASVLAARYESTTIVDSIICMDGCEVIGAYLAEELTKVGIMSINQHQTIYIATPEIHTGGQLIFRDNMLPTIRGKHVLLLIANATTGKTLEKALECIQYYGGDLVGVSAIFSAVSHIHGQEINSIFTAEDILDYFSCPAGKCPLCAARRPVDAIVNSYGYSKI